MFGGPVDLVFRYFWVLVVTAVIPLAFLGDWQVVRQRHLRPVESLLA